MKAYVVETSCVNLCYVLCSKVCSVTDYRPLPTILPILICVSQDLQEEYG